MKWLADKMKIIYQEMFELLPDDLQLLHLLLLDRPLPLQRRRVLLGIDTSLK